MLTKKIGFIGIESYEIIHYLSRVLIHMNKKVLLVDRSETRSLEYSISAPKELKQKVADYRGVDFSDKIPEKSEYDLVLIFYGFKENKDSSDCDDLFFVTDLQVHNMDRLNQKNPCKSKYVIVKNMIPLKINEKFVRLYLDKLELSKERFIFLLEDKRDKECMLYCQWEHVFTFHQISSSLKDLILSILIIACGAEKKEVSRAYRSAERGK